MSKMKTCQKCLVEKTVVSFSNNKRMSDGLCARCKECEAKRKADYISANKEKFLRCARESHARNRERALNGQKIWRIQNKEKIKSRMAVWRDLNKEKVALKDRAWKRANPEKVKANNKNCRAMRKKSEGRITPGLPAKLFKLQRGKCACGCGQPLGTGYHMDHIMPLALGGTNTDDNIQLLRSTCNQQKHAKHPVDFMQSRGFLL